MCCMNTMNSFFSVVLAQLVREVNDDKELQTYLCRFTIIIRVVKVGEVPIFTVPGSSFSSQFLYI